MRRGVFWGGLALFFLPSMAGGETFVLTSLEWPPYAGSSLPDQGTTVRLVRTALAAEGHTLKVEFYPWKRAVQTGLGPGYAGYFPEYPTPPLAEGPCAFSDEIGASPLGLVEGIDHPLPWATLDDLTGHTIGTVAGYVSATDLTRRADQNLLTLDPAVDDLTNVRKVAAGRITLAEIDINVLDWLLQEHPDLQDKVRLNPRLLETKTLHVCFQKTEVGQRARQAFHDGLKRLKARTRIAGP